MTTLAVVAALPVPMVTDPNARELGLTLGPARSGNGESIVRRREKLMKTHTPSVLRIAGIPSCWIVCWARNVGRA